jgi:hypothetical protein
MSKWHAHRVSCLREVEYRLKKMENPPLPPILYKFLGPRRSAAGPICFLGSGRLLRFTQSGSFNDPFECLPAWDLGNVSQDFIEQFLVGKTVLYADKPYHKRRKAEAHKRSYVRRSLREDPKSIQELLTSQARQSADRVSGALSLAGSWNASPMWAHYCDNHLGLAIGIATNSSFFRHSSGNLVYRVDYSTHRPTVDPRCIHDTGYIGKMFFGMKDARWSYENEFRVVRPLIQATKVAGNDARDNPICLFEVPKQTITEVVVGLHATDGFIGEVARLCIDLPNVKLYRIKIGLDTYDFEREELPIPNWASKP